MAEVIEHAANASQQLDQFINAFGTLVQVWCWLAEGKKADAPRLTR